MGGPSLPADAVGWPRHVPAMLQTAAELAAATTVVLASATGLPISTTHTLVGAVLGVGLARGVEALHLPTVGAIVTSWVVTLPAGATLSVIFFYVLRFSFGG